MYLVLGVKSTLTVLTPWGYQELSFSDAGFFGMCPVFENEHDAIKYADGKLRIVEVSEETK